MRRLAMTLAVVIIGAVAAPVRAASEPPFQLEAIASGFVQPVYVTAASRALRLYVVEQRGVIKVLKRTSIAAPWVDGGIFLDLRALVTRPGGGRGMMGMTFHPNFADNGRFYVHYTRRSSVDAERGDIVIAEYRRRTSLRAYPTGRTVLVIDFPTKYHTGGWMAFGKDGHMYVSIGDAAQTALNNGQNLGNLFGKILRFNPRKSFGEAGFIPADNPFVGVAGDDLIWAYGMRHPWRASFDRTTGDIWIGDAGQQSWEEVTRLSPSGGGNGANLGWAMCEGAHAYPPALPPDDTCDAPGTTLPTIEYANDESRCAVIGGYVYRGVRSPSLSGRYFLADYCSGEIWSVPNGFMPGDAFGEPLDTALHPASFGEDATGEIYLVATDGTLWRIVAS